MLVEANVKVMGKECLIVTPKSRSFGLSMLFYAIGLGQVLLRKVALIWFQGCTGHEPAHLVFLGLTYEMIGGENSG